MSNFSETGVLQKRPLGQLGGELNKAIPLLNWSCFLHTNERRVLEIFKQLTLFEVWLFKNVFFVCLFLRQSLEEQVIFKLCTPWMCPFCSQLSLWPLSSRGLGRKHLPSSFMNPLSSKSVINFFSRNFLFT